MRKEQGLTTSASNAQVGIRSLTGAINGTSHDGNRKRRGIVLKPLGYFLGDGNQVNLAAGARAFWQEYSQTVPVPKLMATANFWVQMEIAETKIWEGENVSDVLKDLSEKIMTQVTGTQYVEEEYIEVPTETQIDYAEGEEE